MIYDMFVRPLIPITGYQVKGCFLYDCLDYTADI